jgi:hypothetical protein
MRQHRSFALTLLVVAVNCLPTPGRAQSSDPADAALAGTTFRTHSAEAIAANPANLAWEAPIQRRSRVQIPAGLWAWIFDRPDFDPEQPDFDWIEAVDLSLRNPLTLSLGRDSSVRLGLGGGSVGAQPLARFSPGKLDEVLPPRGGDIGITRVLGALSKSWRLGTKWGTVRVLAAQLEQRTQLDLRPDATLRNWIDGTTPIAGQVGAANVDSWTATNLSSGIGWAKEFRLHTPSADESADWQDNYWNAEDRALRLALGASLRRSTGLLYQRYRGRLEFESVGDLVQYRPQMRRELAKSDFFSDLPGSWAMDLGAALRWRSLEVAAGISDLLTKWTWTETTVDLFQTDAVSYEVTRTREESAARREEAGPNSRWRVDGRWQGGAQKISLAFSGGLGGSDLSAGVERNLNDRLDLRGGLRRDRRQLWQGATGLRWRGPSFDIELGLQSHSYNSSGRRELALSAAVSTAWR